MRREEKRGTAPPGPERGARGRAPAGEPKGRGSLANRRPSADEADLLESRLRAHVARLAGDIGERNLHRPKALAAAADYIEGEWREQGHAVSRQWYAVDGARSANLEVEVKGRARGSGILLLGAHYDTVWGSPGANDNGSGVAALLEAGRAFLGAEPAMAVRLVAFTNEEPPFFLTGQQGSMLYARRARERGDDIRLMVSLETIGCYRNEPESQAYPPLFRRFYPDRGNFLGFVSDFRSRSLMRRAAVAFRAVSDFPLETAAVPRFVPGASWSDHRSFWRRGYPAFMATDTAFYRYPYYHTALDTPEKIAYPGFARAVEGLLRAFLRLAAEGLDGG